MALLLSLVLFAGLGCGGAGNPAPGGESRAPRIATVPTSAPTCTGPHALRIALRQGEYLHAVAPQGTRDVGLTLFDGRGQQLLAVDSLVAGRPPWPAEEIHWVATAPGELRLEVALGGGPAGPCPLRVVEERPASAADRARARAEDALARAHALRRQGDEAHCRQGIEPYGEAERRFAALRLPRRRAEALFGLGLLERSCLRDAKAALAALARAEPLFAAAGDLGALATVRQHLGELHFALGDLGAAIDEYQRALALRKQIGDLRGEAFTANNLGHALDLVGRYDEAATLYDRAIALWREVGDPGELANTLLNRGELDRELAQTDRARDAFEKALALFRRAKNGDREAATLNALGLVALDQKRPAEARARLEAALALRRPGTRGRAVTLAALGVAYRHLDRPEDARRVDAEATPIFARLGDRREEARSLGNLGGLEAAAGHDAAALADLDRARDLFAALADPPDLAWVLRRKAAALRHAGDLAGARRAMEEALTAVERHRFRQRSYDTQQDSYDFLIDLLMEMYRRSPTAGYDAAAFAASERALARSLLDGLAASGAAPSQPSRAGSAALVLREGELEREIEALVARETRLGLDTQTTREQLRSVDLDLASHWEALDRVRADLRAGDPRYAALTQPEPWSAAEVGRRLLDRDTLLLEYRLGAERSFLWALSPGGLVSFELPGRAAIEALGRRACELAARSRGRSAEIGAGQELAKLSRILLAPVASRLPGKRLLIVGDGVLGELPFAALPEPAPEPVPKPLAGRETAEPLVAHHEIVVLPSASVLGELRREVAGRRAAPRDLWVLADPAFGPGFPPLPYARQEAAAILAFAPAPDRHAIVGEAASRDAVLRGDLRDYRFLHFATHGSFAGDEAGGGRLVLAQLDERGRPRANGFLHLGDIYGLDLRADLVVLSACQSALGREVRGEGLMGMTRAFFYAGAERVLVSLWNVNDRVSVELMRRLYAGMLRQGLAPAAALRAAQDAIRREARWRAPYYWAGFVLEGEWRGGSAAAAPDH